MVCWFFPFLFAISPAPLHFLWAMWVITVLRNKWQEKGPEESPKYTFPSAGPCKWTARFEVLLRICSRTCQAACILPPRKIIYKQISLWLLVYVGMIVLTALCGVTSWRSYAPAHLKNCDKNEETEKTVLVVIFVVLFCICNFHKS